MFKVVMKYSDGTTEEDEEVFGSEDEATEHGSYMVSCYHTGGEVLHMSNPGDHAMPGDDEVDFDVIEV